MSRKSIMLNKLKRLSAGRLYYPAALFLVLLFTGMRLAHINADAPLDLSISAATYTDEGFKTYEPRNKVLFGDWKWTPEDEYEGWAKKSPLTALPYMWIFRHYGVSYASIRSLSILYAFLTMIVLFIFLHRNYGRTTALTGLLLYGANFFTAMYNRLGLYETHLLFYIVVSLFGFTEFFRPFRVRRENERDTEYIVKKIVFRTLYFLIGLSGLASGFFIKRNILIVLPSIAPALLIYFGSRFNKSEKFMNRTIVLFIAAFFLVYLVFTELGELRLKLALLLVSIKVFGQPLAAFIPFTAFDPFQKVLSKGMYMEFLFLQPFTFAIGFLFALYTFHAYTLRGRRSLLDLIMASWLIFGFVFTTTLYYSPSRYYLLLAIPLIIAAARFIADFADLKIVPYVAEKKKFPHNAMFGIFLFFSLLYTGVVFFVQAVPASVRSRLVDSLYPAYIKGDLSSAVPIIVSLILIELACIVITILVRRRILGLMKLPKFPSIVLSIVLVLQIFQYGKWFFLHEHQLYTASRQLGRELPSDAVLAGSWSAGLVVENKLRALIVQSLIPYNYDLIYKIDHNVPIPVYSLSGGKKIETYRKDIPLYFAVCRNVIFEKAITKKYENQFVPENLIKKFRLGYFHIEIFKMKKEEKKPNNVVDSLFKSFL
jgi:hypothetical protein